ncbi:MAG: sulfite exporter TauE/SafE family protein [Clostridium sp.]|uniref:sulfite exporter TauE/SafE family protein n=1 Tax=Clostridium sp. TaxID=1506 RepID=UPI002FC5A112
MEFTIEIFLISIIAGGMGALLGLGGGMILSPALTILFGIDIKYAIGASLISVIATSTGSAIAYIKENITNVRIGMFLEMATTIGAIVGALLAGVIPEEFLYIIFGALLVYSAINMIKNRKGSVDNTIEEDPLAERFSLSGEFYDKASNETIYYKGKKVKQGFSIMVGAGVASGLLGIGSGSFKVIAMDTFMKLPLKVSSATSNFMMGVTAAASATIYFFRGDIHPLIAGPVALGVLCGSFLGARLMQRMKTRTLRLIFIPIIVYMAIEMILKGMGVI